MAKRSQHIIRKTTDIADCKFAVARDCSDKISDIIAASKGKPPSPDNMQRIKELQVVRDEYYFEGGRFCGSAMGREVSVIS